MEKEKNQREGEELDNFLSKSEQIMKNRKN